MTKAVKLRETEELNKVVKRRCLPVEEWKLLMEKKEEAKQRNEQRTDRERNEFFYRVVGLQVKKWYIRK